MLSSGCSSAYALDPPGQAPLCICYKYHKLHAQRSRAWLPPVNPFQLNKCIPTPLTRRAHPPPIPSSPLSSPSGTAGIGDAPAAAAGGPANVLRPPGDLQRCTATTAQLERSLAQPIGAAARCAGAAAHPAPTHPDLRAQYDRPQPAVAASAAGAADPDAAAPPLQHTAQPRSAPVLREALKGARARSAAARAAGAAAATPVAAGVARWALAPGMVRSRLMRLAGRMAGPGAAPGVMLASMTTARQRGSRAVPTQAG
eukprot:366106-Chlamydomonas_euryale.AAC.13